MLTPGSLSSQALERALLQCRLVVSSETLAELVEVSTRKKFDRYLPIKVRIAFVLRISSLAEIVTVSVTVNACRDPRDDKFLALAQSASDWLIVTGDDDLLSMLAWEGIPIASPAEFLRTLSPR